MAERALRFATFGDSAAVGAPSLLEVSLRGVRLLQRPVRPRLLFGREVGILSGRIITQVRE